MALYNGAMILPLWFLALCIALPLTVGLAGRFSHWAPRWGLVDASDRRKAHHGDVPIGGLAVVMGSLAALVPLMVMEAPVLLWWIGGAVAVATVGLIDDRQALPPLAKLAVQLGAAVVALQGGPNVTAIDVLGWTIHLGALGEIVLIVWIVGLTNAFNLADGLDGLACGAAVVLGLAMAIMSAVSGDFGMLAFAAALGGTGLGFLAFNHHPARLFLGDGGSYFLGFLLALGTLRATQTDGASNMPLGVLALLWGYPIADTLWAIVRRIKGKRPIFSPDRAHLHHRLLNVVGRYRVTVWILHGLFIVLAGLAVVGWMMIR